MKYDFSVRINWIQLSYKTWLYSQPGIIRTKKLLYFIFVAKKIISLEFPDIYHQKIGP